MQQQAGQTVEVATRTTVSDPRSPELSRRYRSKLARDAQPCLLCSSLIWFDILSGCQAAEQDIALIRDLEMDGIPDFRWARNSSFEDNFTHYGSGARLYRIRVHCLESSRSFSMGSLPVWNNQNRNQTIEMMWIRHFEMLCWVEVESHTYLYWLLSSRCCAPTVRCYDLVPYIFWSLT